MKKVLIVLSVLATGFLASCDKETLVDDESLIDDIAYSTGKQEVAVDALPASAEAYVETFQFDSYVETVNHVSNAGYEVVMGDEETLYFNEAGRRLITARRFFLRKKIGPCGEKGQWIPKDSLSQEITDFIAMEYPDDMILGAREREDVILVLLTSKKILVFDQDGNFLKEVAGFYHCPVLCKPVPVSDLPNAITEYLTTEYPDAEIKIACQKHDKVIVVGLLTPDGRRVVVFDIDGNFLFTRP